ncbi:hypothetical protein PF008_g28771 [Phytophthora fragariae]|uniref:Uncharacterized protein n=1 Tax=Phytophthora fragariae TaxID=53985 RepID=A0A6G0QAE4_9STRA|nr:hypothetical protein PF008_g28771 [Phytophthora fragariae]
MLLAGPQNKSSICCIGSPGCSTSRLVLEHVARLWPSSLHSVQREGVLPLLLNAVLVLVGWICARVEPPCRGKSFAVLTDNVATRYLIVFANRAARIRSYVNVDKIAARHYHSRNKSQLDIDEFLSLCSLAEAQYRASGKGAPYDGVEGQRLLIAAISVGAGL